MRKEKMIRPILARFRLPIGEYVCVPLTIGSGESPMEDYQKYVSHSKRYRKIWNITITKEKCPYCNKGHLYRKDKCVYNDFKNAWCSRFPECDYQEYLDKYKQ